MSGPLSTWSPDHDEHLRAMRARGDTVEMIAASLKRAPSTIAKRVARLGIEAVRSGIWAHDQTEKLKVLHARGDTMGVIAKEFGVSRNAIVGKCRRLGLVRRAPLTDANRELARTQRRDRPKIVREPKPSPMLKAAPPPKPSVVPPQSVPTPFMRTTRLQCLWVIEPLDAPAHSEMLCCGAVVVEGFRYCLMHKAASVSGYAVKRVKPPFEATVVRRAI